MTATTPTQTTPAPLGHLAAVRFLQYGAVRLDPRRNGLNLVRLILAYMVLVAHGWYLSGDGVGPHYGGENIGGWAVYGFFAISGYLITGSRLTKSLGEYIVHRIARIFPAFLICLVVTAFVFAPLGYWDAHHSLDGFLTTATSPLQYVIGNATLRMNAYDVAGTPSTVPYLGAWDGSLWSLYYEFMCYVVVAALACIGFVKRSPWGLGIALAISIALQAKIAWLGPYIQGNIDMVFLIRLLPFFLAGGLLYMIRDRLVLTWPAAVVALGVALLLVKVVDGYGAQLASPLLAYFILWFGAALPCPDLIRKNDISYGIYIYAFPVQQVLALGPVESWNLGLYDLIAALMTAPLAIASWIIVERPVMRRARRSTSHSTMAPPRREPEVQTSPAPAPRVQSDGIAVSGQRHDAPVQAPVSTPTT
ncbi:MAG TPA: acyltransferase [Actinotalea sp.]